MTAPGAVAIRACCHWTRTGLRLEAGRLYRFAATGTWWDAWIRSGPDGYDCPLLDRLPLRRRVPQARWFELMGAVDADPQTIFQIGTRGAEPWRASRSGELTCFANDVSCMWWNNFGKVSLTVEPLAEPGDTDGPPA